MWSRVEGCERWLGWVVALCLIVVAACGQEPSGTSGPEVLEGLHERDRSDQVAVEIREVAADDTPYLFVDLSPATELDPSYGAVLTICQAVDPTPRTRDDQRREVAGGIDRLLKSIEEKPVIQFALRETSTTMGDLRKTWFGPGRAFEHVFCGEARADGKVGGYHWWYKFYVEERIGFVDYEYTIEGEHDPDIATIRFTWDPDGPGKGFSALVKPIGGFTVGDSPAALLALGHLAVQKSFDTNRGRGSDFVANINGTRYRWVVVVDQETGSLVTLYPLANVQ